MPIFPPGVMLSAMKTIFILALLSSSALAQETDLLRCSAVPDKDARLACYDGLAATAIEARRVAATPAAKTQSFGAETTPKKDDIEAIESSIAGQFDGWGPRSVIRLTNGQSWQITDGGSAVLFLKDPKVKIRRAAMGTFMLEIAGSNETARVRRLQ